MSELDPVRRREIIEGFPPSAAGYLGFMNAELGETAGSIFFKMEFPAPDDMSTEELEVIVGDLTEGGWNASVEPRERDGDIGYGIRVQSDKPS